MKRIVIGSDHGGFEYKEQIKEHLSKQGYEIVDVGPFDTNSVDYPDYALALAKVVIDEDIKGILICGTGIGISIAANKCHGIRAGLAGDEFSAQMAREHNDCNVLALGQRVIGIGLALNIVDRYLTSEFIGNRHQRRVDKIKSLENE